MANSAQNTLPASVSNFHQKSSVRSWTGRAYFWFLKWCFSFHCFLSGLPKLMIPYKYQPLSSFLVPSRHLPIPDSPSIASQRHLMASLPQRFPTQMPRRERVGPRGNPGESLGEQVRGLANEPVQGGSVVCPCNFLTDGGLSSGREIERGEGAWNAGRGCWPC